jgi:hypothetical protein
MSPGNRARLLHLSDGEFRRLTKNRTTLPPTRKFKPINLSAARFGQSWDRKRGAAERLTAVLLREDDTALQQRVCENERAG